jgi:hypothetical protein
MSIASVRSTMTSEYTLEKDGILTFGDLVGFVTGLAKAGVPNDARVYAANRIQHPNRRDLVSVHELVVIEASPPLPVGDVQDG